MSIKPKEMSIEKFVDHYSKDLKVNWQLAQQYACNGNTLAFLMNLELLWDKLTKCQQDARKKHHFKKTLLGDECGEIFQALGKTFPSAHLKNRETIAAIYMASSDYYYNELSIEARLCVQNDYDISAVTGNIFRMLSLYMKEAFGNVDIEQEVNVKNESGYAILNAYMIERKSDLKIISKVTHDFRFKHKWKTLVSALTQVESSPEKIIKALILIDKRIEAMGLKPGSTEYNVLFSLMAAKKEMPNFNAAQQEMLMTYLKASERFHEEGLLIGREARENNIYQFFNTLVCPLRGLLQTTVLDCSAVNLSQEQIIDGQSHLLELCTKEKLSEQKSKGPQNPFKKRKKSWYHNMQIATDFARPMSPDVTSEISSSETSSLVDFNDTNLKNEGR